MFDDNPVARSMLRHEVLGREAEEALLRRYSELAAMHGADSREAIAVRGTLIEHNMKLVAMVAGRFKRLPTGVERADLLSVGVFGLITSIEKFDVSRGHRFSTYATWWIRHAIGRHLQDHSSAVRVPVHAQDALRRSEREGAEVEPDAPSERMLESARGARAVLSLNARVNADDDTREFGDLLSDEAPSVLDDMILEQETARVAAAVERLPERLRDVVRERMTDLTLKQVGEAMPEPRSRERVRQLQCEAHALLRRELRTA